MVERTVGAGKLVAGDPSQASPCVASAPVRERK